MPVFTGTPVQVAGSPYLWVIDGGAGGQFSGIFHYGGAVYLSGYEESSPHRQVIAKSTDGGATWTNFIQGGTDNWNPEGTKTVLDAANDKLVFVASNSSTGTIFCFEFDLIGETFSSNTDSGIASTSDLLLVLRANGQIVVVYQHFHGGSAIRPLEGMVVVGNAFGSPFAIDAGSGVERLQPKTFALESNDTIHIAYIVTNTTGNLLYITLDSSNTPGTRQTLSTSGLYGTITNGFISTLYDQIIFQVNGRSTDVAYIFVGTPVSAPVWTNYPTHSPVVGIRDTDSFSVDAGSVIKIFYIHFDSGPQTLLELMEVDWDGSSMGVAQVYWDLIANPPAGAIGASPADMSTDGITVDYTSGLLNISVTTTIDVPGAHLSSVFLSGSPPPPPPPPLVISGFVPLGTIGAPYTFTPTVTGGTPAYTFSILSGTPPAGLSLNTGTGEVSGTITAFSNTCFTIRVTDSLLVTADLFVCIAEDRSLTGGAASTVY